MPVSIPKKRASRKESKADMKVILLQDVKNVGKKDDVVEVSQGFGANYLIRGGLAVMYTAGSRKVLEKQQQQKAEEEEKKRSAALTAAERLKEITLEFQAPSSKDGRMFGNISPKQICEMLEKNYQIAVDKRKFIDKFPVNAFGFTRLKVELYKGVVATLNIHVTEKK